jgi:hypothetical protein
VDIPLVDQAVPVAHKEPGLALLVEPLSIKGDLVELAAAQLVVVAAGQLIIRLEVPEQQRLAGLEAQTVQRILARQEAARRPLRHVRLVAPEQIYQDRLAMVVVVAAGHSLPQIKPVALAVLMELEAAVVTALLLRGTERKASSSLFILEVLLRRPNDL